MEQLYIGLMSGTSADGIDAALVDFSNNQISLKETHFEPYNEDTQKKIHALSAPSHGEIEKIADIDVFLGHAFAHAASQLLKKAGRDHTQIQAIGSHGQTIRHYPSKQFTLQIADPNIIAAKTDITTVADFRRKDLALGGHGAPLVPAFHHALFNAHAPCVIANIGGIANITVLNKTIVGFDTGPGNTLMDAWMREHHQKSHDEKGAWAATGQINQTLFSKLLEDAYFNTPAPKSTGREYFNLSWLKNKLGELKIEACDVQATLAELTAKSLIDAASNHIKKGEIIICGGGAHNHFLIDRLKTLSAPHFTIHTTEKYGIHPDWIEAIAFAWLAKQTIKQLPGNIPAVTGAEKETILGGVYFA